MYQGHFSSDNHSKSRPAPKKRRGHNRRSIFPFIVFVTGIILILMALNAFLSRITHPAADDLMIDQPTSGTSAAEPSSNPTEAETEASTKPNEDIPEAIRTFAQINNVDITDYPPNIIKLYQKNPEAAEFALNYPLEYGKDHEIDMAEYEQSDSMPLFMQWDKRWGYLDYDGDVAGLSACGPICLSMVGYYLTGDEETFRPDNVIEFAIENGYCVPGNGSSWTLISEGGEQLGLDVTEIPLDLNRMIENLEVGNPIICIMGPGAFTTSGHFIVLTEMENGKFRINDPNSRANSERLWSFDEFQDEILNLWVLRSF